MGEKLVRCGLRDIEKAFKKVDMEMTGTGDIVCRFVEGGRQAVSTKFSMGRGDVPTFILGRIKQQLRLSLSEFNDLISCPLKRDGLIRIYKWQGLLPS